MPKILILMPCDSGLPVPAVKGGAVPTLIESILKISDKKRNADLTILTTHDEQAKNESKKYPKAKFIWIKIPGLLKWFDSLLFKGKKYLQKLYAIYRIHEYLKKNDFDAVVVQNVGYLLKVFKHKDIKNKFEGKLIYHLHNDIPHNADKQVLKGAKFIVISNYLIKGVNDYCGEDVSNRTRVVKNGICTDRFRRELSKDEAVSIRNKYGIGTNQPIILFVGRIVKEKGIDELLDAMHQLKNEAVLLVVGSTNFGAENISPFEKKIRAKCSNLGERVKFTGFIHNDDIWKLYQLADLAVLPSTWNEPAGLTMMEACISGTPLITTNKGGIPEYIQSDGAICLDVNDQFTSTLAENIDHVLERLPEYKIKARSNVQTLSEKFDEDLFYESFITGIKELTSDIE